MNILVTGGAGFIGSHFVRTVIADEHVELVGADITVLDSLTYSGNPANLASVAGNSRLRFVEGDVCDPGTVERLVAGHDAIVHFAAETHVDRSIESGPVFGRTNVMGTLQLLESASRHRVDRFVHVSTDEVYGSIAEGAWSETSPLLPNSPYSASKAGADLLALAYHRTHGLPVTVTRGSNTYGPYQFPEKIVPLFVTNLLDGRPVPLYGDGRNVRDWLHVDDHVRGVVLALAAGRAGEVYNIGGGTELTNRELTGRLLRACGAGWDSVVHVPDRKGHDLRYALDIGRISAELGYAPRVPFDEGLTATVEWYRARRDWWSAARRRRYGHPDPATPVSGR
ncbi:dTDP-glucose 4,6-dehydratase [Micromonospora sp. KLBMP9576]|uniref:dTDP-glucose 4,6-dehydratase n=1 Tax=Micromonospora sp. KLBMP9576 TaxID=3424769 RepID=UPI003D8C73E1